jgi:hypothetical protein
MFKVEVPEVILTHSKQQVELHDFGQRSTANGTTEQQTTGIIGQSMIQSLFGLQLVDGGMGCDDGTDITYEGVTIDVKTMGRTTDVRPYYVNNFLALQLKFKTELLIFCSFNKITNELTICGWCTKEHFKSKASYHPKGVERTRSDGTTFKTFADLYELANAELLDVLSLGDLKAQLTAYSKQMNEVK